MSELDFDFVDLPLAFLERVVRFAPVELHAGLDLGLCGVAAASGIRERGLVRGDPKASFEEQPSFRSGRSNPAWVWYLLHARWLFETGLEEPGTLDKLSALNADFGHPERFEYHPSETFTPPVRFLGIVEAWASALAHEFEARAPF